MAKPSSQRPNWARQLRAARLAKGWNAETFAAKLGCGQSTLRNAESGNPRGVGKVFENLSTVIDPATAKGIIQEWNIAAASPLLTRATRLRQNIADTYEDAEVNISLYPSSWPFLAMAVELTVTTHSPNWIVGVTTDELVADHLCALTPLINEMICPGPAIEQQEAVQFSLSVHDPSKRRVRATSVQMEAISADTLSTRTDDDLFSEFSDVQWYLGDLVSIRQTEASSLRLTFLNRHLIDFRARYCFWSAGRDMHLRTLRLDARSFPKAESRRFSLQPFLSVPMRAHNTSQTGVYDLSIDNLVEAGNGIALIWGDAE